MLLVTNVLLWLAVFGGLLRGGSDVAYPAAAGCVVALLLERAAQRRAPDRDATGPCGR